MVGKNRSEKLEILHRLRAVLFLICSGIIEQEEDVFEKFHAMGKGSLWQGSFSVNVQVTIWACSLFAYSVFLLNSPRADERTAFSV